MTIKNIITNLNKFKFVLFYIITILVGIILIYLIYISILPNNIYGDLELNLGTTFLSILLTVTIVDWIIKKRDEKLWSNVSLLILKRANTINKDFIVYILRYLYPDFFDWEITKKPKPEKYESIMEVIEVTKELIYEQIDKKIEEFTPIRFTVDSSELEQLRNDLKLLHKCIDEFIINFGNKADPKIYSHLLNLQDIFQIIIKDHFDSTLELTKFISDSNIDIDRRILITISREYRANVVLRIALDQVMEFNKKFKNKDNILPPIIWRIKINSKETRK
ncbi:hypothetical protein [Methanobacterium sp. MBAC-LM]|uniref:hypothetical protein n=1 Tax=Methanobacterium sp. MBAC-LM TaxID=3412034 RepID=UPI003C708D16